MNGEQIDFEKGGIQMFHWLLRGGAIKGNVKTILQSLSPYQLHPHHIQASPISLKTDCIVLSLKILQE